MNTSPNGQSILSNAVTALFVPGDRPERFRKAYASGADVIIIDLEDAVSEENKDVALENILAALSPGQERIEAVVRINKERISSELPALLELATVQNNGLVGIMIPKVESPQDIPPDLGGLPIIALVETAVGIENISSIARAEGLTRLAFGAVDFAADMQSSHESIIGYAQTRILLSTQAAGLSPALDSPSVEISDLEKVSQDSRHAYALGFGGKLCIHPAQLPAVEQGFAPSEEEILWAKEVISISGGAHQVQGKMVDLPVIERAKRILARVESSN